MHVKFILPTLAPVAPRAIKYALFPPLGLGLLAGYLAADDTAEIVDEHVTLTPHYNDTPDLVAISVAITCASRAYQIADAYRARGVYVVMGGLHATLARAEVQAHCDTLIVGSAERAFPQFLADFRRRRARAFYEMPLTALTNLPPIRRDLFAPRRYLSPNSLVVSRGCPHRCDFCYNTSFYHPTQPLLTAPLTWVNAELATLSGKHLYFLDDNLFADAKYARQLLALLQPLKRVWQGSTTVAALRDEELLAMAVAAGLRSLFIGFESLSSDVLATHGKTHNRADEYAAVIRRLHDYGVMINASFIFGLANDDVDVFARTVDWAIANGIETATFHLLTPYPGTALFATYAAAGKITVSNGNLYDTRHAVFAHPQLSSAELVAGNAAAYRQFYAWRSLWRAARVKKTWRARWRHLAYASAWKKFDWLWRAVMATRQLPRATKILEWVLR